MSYSNVGAVGSTQAVEDRAARAGAPDGQRGRLRSEAAHPASRRSSRVLPLPVAPTIMRMRQPSGHGRRLAATPEYAQGLRLPDARWQEIAPPPLRSPAGVRRRAHAVKSHWRKVLLPRQMAAVAAVSPPPPPPPESRPSAWTDAGDAVELLAAVKLLHEQHGLHVARRDFWELVETRCPSAPHPASPHAPWLRSCASRARRTRNSRPQHTAGGSSGSSGRVVGAGRPPWVAPRDEGVARRVINTRHAQWQAIDDGREPHET